MVDTVELGVGKGVYVADNGSRYCLRMYSHLESSYAKV